MLDSHKFISTQIEKDIPQFIRMDYPYFVEFIKKYYEWMEKEGSPYHFIANALNYSDVDRTDLEMINVFARNFLHILPDIIYEQNNIATLVKTIEQFYSARGSEKSFDFLFRLFDFKEDNSQYNDIYYPSYDMLRISDGKWTNYKSVKIIGPPSPDSGDSDWERYIKENNLAQWKIDLENTKSGVLEGNITGTKNVVDYTVFYESTSGLNIGEVFLIEYDVLHTPDKLIKESFIITTIDGNQFTGNIENTLHDIEITNTGKYYIPSSRVNISCTGDGEDGMVKVDTISKGIVDSITIIDGGKDYAVNNKIIISGLGFGANAQAIVDTVDGNGAITSIKMISNGANYDRIPSATVETKTGTGAILIVESDSIGNVVSTEQRDFGINYLSAETTITFNTMVRIYNNDFPFLIGEHITTGTNTGVVEYFDPIGNILSVRIINGMFSPNDIITGSINGGTATVYDTSLAEGQSTDGILCEYKGDYINNDGQISSNKFIQDSFFYQMFSYMIKSRNPKSDWVGYLKDIHPAGTVILSYEDTDVNYLREIEGAEFISPKLDTTEFYKFVWEGEQYHGGHVNHDRNNTQVKQYGEYIIDLISNINNTEWNKTMLTFGSEITIE